MSYAVKLFLARLATSANGTARPVAITHLVVFPSRRPDEARTVEIKDSGPLPAVRRAKVERGGG